MIIRRWLVWLSRIHRCRGFGIQSPTDYAFVRYVINERWPYYAYEELKDRHWLTRKLGRLYFRLANWRQPTAMLTDDYRRFWQRGCGKIRFTDHLDTIELARVDINDKTQYELLLPRCNAQSVIIVEGIYRNWERWHEMEHAPQVGTTFDLYYCGIILLDTDRPSHHYKINF